MGGLAHVISISTHGSGRGVPGLASYIQIFNKTTCAAAALALLAGAAPHALGEPSGLCVRSLHAADAEYEIVDVSHDITDGNFLGLCANQEYGVFDVFVDSGSAEELVLTIPKEEFDPRQFDYQRCGFGYGANGSGSKHAGIRAEQISQTDEQRVIRFSWDMPVSQISYLKSPRPHAWKNTTPRIAR